MHHFALPKLATGSVRVKEYIVNQTVLFFIWLIGEIIRNASNDNNIYARNRSQNVHFMRITNHFQGKIMSFLNAILNACVSHDNDKKLRKSMVSSASKVNLRPVKQQMKKMSNFLSSFHEVFLQPSVTHSRDSYI